MMRALIDRVSYLAGWVPIACSVAWDRFRARGKPPAPKYIWPATPTLLDVPLHDTDEALAAGARYSESLGWYLPAGVNPMPFARWWRD